MSISTIDHAAPAGLPYSTYPGPAGVQQGSLASHSHGRIISRFPPAPCKAWVWGSGSQAGASIQPAEMGERC